MTNGDSLISSVKVVLIIMFMYSAFVSMILYSLPAHVITTGYADPFSTTSSDFNIDEVTTDVQNSLDQQTNLPIINSLAMVYYSGNIFLDLLVNFAFALPQMITIIISGFMLLFGAVNVELMVMLEQFFIGIMVVIYFIGLMQLLTGLRAGQRVV